MAAPSVEEKGKKRPAAAAPDSVDGAQQGMVGGTSPIGRFLPGSFLGALGLLGQQDGLDIG